MARRARPIREADVRPRRRVLARAVLAVPALLAAEVLLVLSALQGHAAGGSLPGRIVFVTQQGVVGLMRPDGTGVRKIATIRPGTESGIGSPMLSPDGTELLSFGGEGTLGVTNLPSTKQAHIAGDAALDTVYEAGWLASNQVALVSWHHSGAAEIEIVGADGTNRHLVVRDPRIPLPTAGPIPTGLAASPDGTEIAFISSSGGIDAVGIRTGRIRTIARPQAQWTITGLSWAPGSSLLFSQALGDITTRVRRVRPDGTGLTTMLTGPNDQQPSWGPDGAHFLVVQPSRGRIVIVDVGSGATRTVGPPGVVDAAWGGPAAKGPGPSASPSTSTSPSVAPTGGGAPPGAGGGPGRPAPSFAQSVVTPGQLGLKLTHVVTNVVLSFVIVLLIPLVTEVFNSTFEANYARITRPFAGLARFASTARAPLGRWAVVGFAGSMVVVTVLYCFLDPTFGWNRGSLATYLGMLSGLVLVTLAFDAVAAWYLWRRHAARASFRAYSGGILLAAACVLVSRLAQFQPGYLLGAIAGFAFAVTMSDREEGALAARSATWMLGLSMVAWALSTPVAHALGPHPALGLRVLHSTLAAVVVAGIEGAAFGLIPIRFLVGEKVIAWSRAGWTAIFGAAVFAFVSIVLNPRGNYVGTTAVGPVWATVALLVSFTAATTGLWAYFRWRPEPPAAERQPSVTEPTGG